MWPKRGFTPREAVDDTKPGARTRIMTRCPECESDLDLDGYELDIGETINCPECAVELKVVSNEPVSVSLAGGDD